MNYIHNNPVKAELVGQLEDYLYSSARDYTGEKGLDELVMVLVLGGSQIRNQEEGAC